jgi:hypothetical protein
MRLIKRRRAVSALEDDDDYIEPAPRRVIKLSAPKPKRGRTIRLVRKHPFYIDQEEIHDDELYAVSVFVRSHGYHKTKVFEGFRIRYVNPKELGIICYSRDRFKPINLAEKAAAIAQRKSFVFTTEDPSVGFDVQLVNPRKWEGTAHSINRRLGWENV